MRITATCALLLALASAPAWAAIEPRADGFGWPADGQSPDDLYTAGRNAIDGGQFDRAIADFRKLAETTQARADGALYWIAYAQNKLGERADALRTLADLQRRFATSRWAHDAKALELEIRQASGQKVSPDAQQDDELKLLALNGLMGASPDRVLPLLEQMLESGSSSPKVRDRALFVLSQSRTPEARAIIGKVAKDGSKPDLQLRAVKYVGLMGGDEDRDLLADVYRSAADVAVKRAVLKSLMISGDRSRLFSTAKSETTPELRAEAVAQLGVMGAEKELSELYATEQATEIRKRILQAMFVGGSSDRLLELARTEKNEELRRAAIRDLGLMGSNRTADALVSMYQAGGSPDIRKAVVEALFLQNNAHALVGLARAEKSPEMKKDIVSKLSLMHSKEATDYLAELLK